MDFDVKQIKRDMDRLYKFLEKGNNSLMYPTDVNTLGNMSANILGGVKSSIESKYKYSRVKDINKKNEDKLLRALEDNQLYLNTMASSITDIYDSCDYIYMPMDDALECKSKSDIICTLLEFMKSVSDRDYEITKSMFRNGLVSDEFYNPVYGGLCNWSYYLQKCYVLLFTGLSHYGNGCILSHEIGHAIDFYKYALPYGQMKPYYKCFLDEVPSTFYERIFLDYIKDNKIDEKASDVYFNRRSFPFICYADDVIDFYNYMSEGYDNGNIKLEELYNYNESFNYFIGNYVSIHLAVLYRKDKKKALEILDEICSNRLYFDYDIGQILDYFKIDIDSFIDGDYIEPYIRKRALDFNKRFNISSTL